MKVHSKKKFTKNLRKYFQKKNSKKITHRLPPGTLAAPNSVLFDLRSYIAISDLYRKIHINTNL